LVDKYHVEEIVIAMPEATGRELRRIIDISAPTGARVRTLPSALSIVSGTQQISSYLRDVDIEDLLKREPIETDLKSISQYLSGERVMITGGGGSIGSELARQITSLSPASLILVGKGENSLYEIEQELIQTNRFRPKTVVADVRDYASMERVMKEHAPTVVFHAAAHKHVPLMESNPIEAIQNNVLGTWHVADLCIRYGVKKMVLISSDKAVKPSSIMGATKRVGEMILGGLALRSETEFAIVRFGNVMGSRGSLIPLLKSQLKRGGPLTITHPDMTRYFMTIPEAVQLIIQAGAMGGRSEIFILDMGEPVRIVDLARDLIRLHGLVPDEDIEIIFTGVRPGEKMHEELAGDTEALAPAGHPKIHSVANGNLVNWNNLKAKLRHLLSLCEGGKAQEAHTFLMELALGKSGEPYEDPERWPDSVLSPAEFSGSRSPVLMPEAEERS
jgi:FlaA1/EpsC-like NDP-sugar epimerase